MKKSDVAEKLRFYVRLKRLASKLDVSGNQGALITSEKNIFYLTDFANSEGTLFVTRDKTYFLVDFRYGEAVKNSVTNCEVVVYKKYYEALIEIIKRHEIKEIMTETESITVRRFESFRKIFAECGCEMSNNDTLDKLLTNLRIVKSSEEIKKIKQAQKITEEAFTELLNYVKVGAVERELALELEFLMRKKGASGVSFDLITIAGKNTSKPHGVPGEYAIRSGDFVTFDIGAVYEGYHSDMTRTIAVGDVSEFQREIYNIVYKAQTAAVSTVKAGVKASYVDKVARDIITQQGYGECFGHSTGHGVGLDIHEQPFVSTRTDIILSEGMIITVEPGIYIPEKFGVRIEDMGAVTSKGYDNFASLPKELIVL